MTNSHGDMYWEMSSDNYCAALVENTEYTIKKNGILLTSKAVKPLSNGYKPEQDTTGELKGYDVQWYQEMVGCLRWEIEIGRVDIFLETELMSQHLEIPIEGHLKQVIHIIVYLKRNKKL